MTKHLNYNADVTDSIRVGDRLRTPVYAKDPANDRVVTYEVTSVAFDASTGKTQLDLEILEKSGT